MARGKSAVQKAYTPNQQILDLWPDITGSQINGLGETESGRPRPVFWRTDDSISHSAALQYFYKRDVDNPRIAESRKYRQETAAIPVSDIAPTTIDKSAAAWTEELKSKTLELGADDVGICEYREEWTFEDRPLPQGKFAVVMAFAHNYPELNTAPDERAYIEVMRQYARAGDTSKHLANWVREAGHFAAAKTGPNTEDVLMIPAAVAAGLGELGKHGSMIHRKLGANFRLSMILTDLPLLSDSEDVFGGDDFCMRCQVCSSACPPEAISREKVMVRGNTKWFVDFDKCLPYFIDNKTCGICLAVCPWSRPGVADNLVVKMARKREARLKE
ncbi:MAG: 4Fe-4S dicluster domain-containing protein [Gammaproteobacteria bacterium]|nr:4Fe-4S dicluster domain-containing protein [Gammaproteobacteria bacterium]